MEDDTWKEHAKKLANRQKYEKREYLLVQNAMLGKNIISGAIIVVH